MRVIALEEHFVLPDLMNRIPTQRISDRGNPSSDQAPSLLKTASKRLADLGEGRLADMDTNGISMQVLSWAGPGADLLDAEQGAAFAKDANDGLAKVVKRHPDRFGAFAHLPVTADDAGVAELKRCVQELGFQGGMINGTTQGRFLDDPTFEPLLATAESLGVPLYIHPNIPPAAVRDAYYKGLPPVLGFELSTYGFGWHVEVGIHLLRLVLSGTLNRHQKLKLIAGHMGELLPMTLARTEKMVGPDYAKFSDRTISEQLREQVWFSTSGLFTLPPLQILIDTFGIDRVLFSVDYPYSDNSEGRQLIDTLPFAQVDIENLCHGNAEGLLRFPPQ
jgi:hypothetical protein